MAFRAYRISAAEIAKITQIFKQTIRDIYCHTVDRGFDPKSSLPLILNTHINDTSHLSRPFKQTEDTKNIILEKVCCNRYGKEKICAYVAAEIKKISTKTVWQILKASRLRKTKLI